MPTLLRVAITLNKQAVEHAKHLVREGRYVRDDRDAWSEHQPSAERENEFIERHGWAEYAKWHLGVERSEPEDVKARYKFPYGDFARVHRCGLLSAESRAGQYKHLDVEKAAHELHAMIDAKAEKKP